MRFMVLIIPALLLSGAACENFTEYSGPPEAGLIFIDPDNLQIAGSLDGVPGARGLCAGLDGEFFVSSSTGRLYFCNSVSMTLDTSLVIGQGSSSGYSSMAHIPWKNSLYIVGPLGNILEVSVGQRAVVSDFTAGSAPSFILASRGNDFIFVTDPPGNRVRAVRTTTNSVQRNWLFDETPTVMGNNPMGADTLLISTNCPTWVSYMQPCETGGVSRALKHEAASDIVSSPFLNLILTAHPRPGNPTGRVAVIDSLFPGFSIRHNVTVPGNPNLLQLHNDQIHFFVLSSGGDGTSTLFSYMITQSVSLVNSVELPGYPADMIMAGNRLVILTF